MVEIDSADTLAECGEFRLLNEIVLPLFADQAGVSPLGDDCALVDLPDGSHRLVVTSDAAPRPLAWALGHESYHTWGWYAAAVNASDLASAAAKPLALTTSLEAPSSMKVAEYYEGLVETKRDR